MSIWKYNLKINYIYTYNQLDKQILNYKLQFLFAYLKINMNMGIKTDM